MNTETKSTIDTNNYVIILYGVDGKNYSLDGASYSGPMATGTDEWGDRSYNELGTIRTKDEAIDIANDPRVGYGKPPQGNRVVYRIVLEKVYENSDDPEQTKIELEKKKQAALSKLSYEEKKILGL